MDMYKTDNINCLHNTVTENKVEINVFYTACVRTNAFRYPAECWSSKMDMDRVGLGRAQEYVD